MVSSEPATVFGKVYDRIEFVGSNVEKALFEPYDNLGGWISAEGRIDLRHYGCAVEGDVRDFTYWMDTVPPVAFRGGKFTLGLDGTSAAELTKDDQPLKSGETYSGDAFGVALTFQTDQIWGNGADEAAQLNQK